LCRRQTQILIARLSHSGGISYVFNFQAEQSAMFGAIFI